MISTNISIKDGNLDYRDIIGFYFAKWFDEPFTVDVLNRTHFRNLIFTLGNHKDDFLHRDYHFIGHDNKIHYVDAKTHTHNYEYDRTKVTSKATDVISIGQYANNSSTEFFSFVYRQRIYFIYHQELSYIKPFESKLSSGQNNKAQTLSHYLITDLINLPHSYYTDIPDDMWNCYEEAYSLFTKARETIFINTSPLKKKSVELLESEKKFHISVAEDMKEKLIPIINRFNMIYDELPKEDENSVLSDIYSLLN